MKKEIIMREGDFCTLTQNIYDKFITIHFLTCYINILDIFYIKLY